MKTFNLCKQGHQDLPNLNYMKLDDSIEDGIAMYKWAQDLWPLNRSITGDGLRSSLQFFQRILPGLRLKSIKSGTKVFDWIVPKEWAIKEARIENINGERIVDFKNNNLHVVGYSHAVDKIVSRGELFKHLHTIPDKPLWIPYVTSYYEKNWGFCASEETKNKLTDSHYRVFIDATHFEGRLDYADLVIKSTQGRREEILLTSYVCHPSMANNELSGPVLTVWLARWISSMRERKYNYRFVLAPETIGSLVYIYNNKRRLKRRTIAGFNLTCVGDERTFSFIPSRSGNSLTDRIARHCLKWISPGFKEYTWNDRGSDERQYCSPGIDLPMASIMRSKYGTYPEYHTSADDLKSVVTAKGLSETAKVYQKMILVIENNIYLMSTNIGEAQLGKRGLYPNISNKNNKQTINIYKEILTWADGSNDLVDIADRIGRPAWMLFEAARVLLKEDLVEIVKK